MLIGIRVQRLLLLSQPVKLRRYRGAGWSLLNALLILCCRPLTLLASTMRWLRLLTEKEILTLTPCCSMLLGQIEIGIRELMEFAVSFRERPGQLLRSIAAPFLTDRLLPPMRVFFMTSCILTNQGSRFSQMLSEPGYVIFSCQILSSTRTTDEAT